ncbi:YraN family protein [Candidatus Woesebacteria bacterium]|nr:YraN family protein [Candidatus Woesebacteria bacterium]
MPKISKDTRSIGFKGEKYAGIILQEKGYKILEYNFYTRLGEIDLIAEDNDTLVFVEVKLRRSKRFGMPEESVTLKKLEKIKKTGQIYLKKNKLKYYKLRIDVVSLLFEKDELVREKLLKGVYLW